jgi:hypothetical protein
VFQEAGSDVADVRPMMLLHCFSYLVVQIEEAFVCPHGNLPSKDAVDAAGLAGSFVHRIEVLGDEDRGFAQEWILSDCASEGIVACRKVGDPLPDEKIEGGGSLVRKVKAGRDPDQR